MVAAFAAEPGFVEVDDQRGIPRKPPSERRSDPTPPNLRVDTHAVTRPSLRTSRSPPDPPPVEWVECSHCGHRSRTAKSMRSPDSVATCLRRTSGLTASSTGSHSPVTALAAIRLSGMDSTFPLVRRRSPIREAPPALHTKGDALSAASPSAPSSTTLGSLAWGRALDLTGSPRRNRTWAAGGAPGSALAPAGHTIEQVVRRSGNHETQPESPWQATM